MSLDQSKWYLFPIKSQKLFALLFMRSQNPTVLYAGTVPLNMNTFVSVRNICHTPISLLILIFSGFEIRLFCSHDAD